MTHDTRTQALLDLVEDDRRAQCEAIVAAAEQQAAALLTQARTEARQRVREVFAQQRPRAQARVAAARARLQTRSRLHEQQRATAWLALGWQRLPQALRARWQDGAARRMWVDAAIDSARRVLAPGAWRVVFAAGAPECERVELAARLQRDIGAAAVFVEDARIDAGLRIVADGNVVDATLGGLTADRSEIGALLLGEGEQAS